MEQVMAAGQNLSSPSSVVITIVDVVHLGIGKVNPFGGQIQRQTVGPEDLAGQNARPVGTVHVDSLDARVISPIGPEEDSGIGTGIEGDTAWLVNVFGQEDHPVGSVFSGHFDRVQSGIDPVKILGDPIQCQAFDKIRSAADDGLGRSRQLLAEDLLRLHVVPVEDVGMSVGGQRYDIFHFDRDNFDRFLFQVGDEEGSTVGNEQEGAARVDGLASVFVFVQDVAIGARADERFLRVPTRLGTTAWDLAFIQIDTDFGVVGHQNFTGRAQTQRAGGRLLATVGARTTVVVAIFGIATRSFIRATGAISLSVAHLRNKSITSACNQSFEYKLLTINVTCVMLMQRSVTLGHCHCPAGHWNEARVQACRSSSSDPSSQSSCPLQTIVLMTQRELLHLK